MRRKKPPPATKLRKSWEEQTGRRNGHILRRKKTPLAAELKKKLGGTEWKKEWPHFEEEKNTSCY